ncbi:hypothetical protein IE81DRAFT_332271 [Ceraceosorus guamensis]|uniref:Uncharacterized protein n=1 Tax=Ceraceosorus guamensis TaxID=1522189 RepID=A0A316VPU3_9BASI|nr:hypothetical protein IE81DRAFT_332271 [Ceraceosorus guamensis]PWN39542.1 hypothetical protein IE81DRAFT_332271 [Ceraceosorus guamensis]
MQWTDLVIAAVLVAMASTDVLATGNIGEIYTMQKLNSPTFDMLDVIHTGTAAEGAKDVFQYNCAKLIKQKGGVTYTNHYRRSRLQDDRGSAVCILRTTAADGAIHQAHVSSMPPRAPFFSLTEQSVLDEVLKSIGWSFGDTA